MPTPPSSLYVDGASQLPMVLAGRGEVEASLAAVLRDIETGRQPRHHGIVGARGLGKTAVLNTFRRVAQDSGHSVILLSGRRGDDESLLGDLGHYTVELARKVRPFRRRARTALKTSVSEMTATLKLGVVTAGIKTDPIRAAASQSLTIAAEQTLQLVARELARSGHGLLVVIDEAQAALPSELRRITGLIESVSADSPNVALVMAGLPELEGATTQSSFTFVERYAWHHLEPLTRAETGQALRHPLEYQGRTITDDAVVKAWGLSHGHPHVVQLVARHMLNSAGSEEVVTVSHVQAATSRVRAEMQSVYRARWNKLDELEKSLIRQIAAAVEESGERLVPFERLAIAMDLSPREVHDLGTRMDTVKVVSWRSALHLDVPGIGQWALHHHPAVSDTKVAGPQQAGGALSISMPGGAAAEPVEASSDYQRLSLLIEQRAKRAELGLGSDPALEAAWSKALQDAGAGSQRTQRFTRASRRAPAHEKTQTSSAKTQSPSAKTQSPSAELS